MIAFSNEGWASDHDSEARWMAQGAEVGTREGSSSTVLWHHFKALYFLPLENPLSLAFYINSVQHFSQLRKYARSIMTSRVFGSRTMIPNSAIAGSDANSCLAGCQHSNTAGSRCKGCEAWVRTMSTYTAVAQARCRVRNSWRETGKSPTAAQAGAR
jgi:hypothetical protein